MISLKRGKDIAVIKEGKNKGKMIKLYGGQDFDEKLEPDLMIDRSEYSEILPKSFYKEQNITPAKKREFVRLLNSGETKDISEEMREHLQEAEKVIDEELRNKIFFEEKGTKLFPIPQKFSERIYVPAPSGSGKSTFIGMYLEELKKMKGGKNRKIFLFSRVAKDEPLDKHKPIRIPLEEEFFAKHPLEIEEFKNSIIIFDDIDTIINKSVVKYVRRFRDDVLETGRHYDISVLSTSHIIANFLATRTLINEANAIVLFPKGSSFYAVSNFLERYLGFNKQQIKYVEQLPTRWIWFWKEYPKYAIHEKGAFLY
tara:strand:- start:384 stop:1322 length:939 start_codon:yes stop_codon:yes gene_type:complete